MSDLVVDATIPGGSCYGQADLLWQGEGDSAVAVFDRDVSHGGRVGDVHGAVGVDEVYRTGDSLKRDIARTGMELNWPNQLRAGKLLI